MNFVRQAGMEYQSNIVHKHGNCSVYVEWMTNVTSKSVFECVPFLGLFAAQS
jgi:hypothetical protein